MRRFMAKSTKASIYQPLTQKIMSRNSMEGFNNPSEQFWLDLDSLIIELQTEDTGFDTRDSFQLYRLGDTSLKGLSTIDWKNPNGDLATDHGTDNYTIDGVKGNGTDSYRNTKFNPSLANIMTIDTIGITHILVDDYDKINSIALGCEDSSPTRRMYIVPNSISGWLRPFVNDITGVNLLVTPLDAFILDYGRVNDMKYVFANGDSGDTIASAITPIIDSNYGINAILNEVNSARAFANGTCGLFAAGSAVTETQHNNLRTALNNFFTKIGIATI